MSPKRVALIAHDNKKKELIEWVKFNLESIRKCEIYATGTTGKQPESDLDLKVARLYSGPRSSMENSHGVQSFGR